jgi:uncharacterized damage-inducible protein DinB
MTPKVQKLWDILEAQRIHLFEKLDKEDPSVFNQKPTPETWSANQNLEHLLRAEAASLAYLKKKLTNGGSDIPKAGVKSWYRRFVLRIAFGIPTLKFKAPKYLDNLPDDLDYHTIKTTFATQRTELKNFIDSLPNPVLESEVWKHQAAGKMSIAQMLDFFEDHFGRHEKQLGKAISRS